MHYYWMGNFWPAFGANLMVLDREYDKSVRVFLKKRLIDLLGSECVCGDVCLVRRLGFLGVLVELLGQRLHLELVSCGGSLHTGLVFRNWPCLVSDYRVRGYKPAWRG